MSRFEHMRVMRAEHRSEVFEDFMSMLSRDIPIEYLKHMQSTYGLTPDDLHRAGTRYLGSDYKRVLTDITQMHGCKVLLKAGLFFNNSNKTRTIMRFEPPLWRRVPLLITPCVSQGFIDLVVGYAPVSDKALSDNDLCRWWYSKRPSVPLQSALINLTGVEARGVVILCPDFFKSLQLRKHGYEALYIAQFKKFNPVWIKKLGQCRVYIDPADVLTYPEETDSIFKVFEEAGREIGTASTWLSTDYMADLRRSVGLPPEDPEKLNQRPPQRRQVKPLTVVSPKGDLEVTQVSMF